MASSRAPGQNIPRREWTINAPHHSTNVIGGAPAQEENPFESPFEDSARISASHISFTSEQHYDAIVSYFKHDLHNYFANLTP